MESFAGDLREMARTPLHQSHVQAIRDLGTEVRFDAGTMIAEVGDPMDRFLYILEGRVEIIDTYTREAYLPSSLGPDQFIGEITFLNGGAYTLPLRAKEDTILISVSRKDMLAAMSRIPEMSDIIISVFAARRRRQVEEHDTSLKLVGADVDRDVRRVAEFAARNKIAFQMIDLGSEDAEEIADVVRAVLGKTFSAIAALQQEGPPHGDLGQLVLQRLDLRRHCDRRHRLQHRAHRVRLLPRPARLLQRRAVHRVDEAVLQVAGQGRQ